MAVVLDILLAWEEHQDSLLAWEEHQDSLLVPLVVVHMLGVDHKLASPLVVIMDILFTLEVDFDILLAWEEHQGSLLVPLVVVRMLGVDHMLVAAMGIDPAMEQLDTKHEQEVIPIAELLRILMDLLEIPVADHSFEAAVQAINDHILALVILELEHPLVANSIQLVYSFVVQTLEEIPMMLDLPVTRYFTLIPLFITQMLAKRQYKFITHSLLALVVQYSQAVPPFMVILMQRLVHLLLDY